MEQGVAVQDVAEQPAAEEARGTGGAAVGAEGAGAQGEGEREESEERAAAADGEPCVAAEHSVGEPQRDEGRQTGGARQQRPERPGGARLDVVRRSEGGSDGLSRDPGDPCEEFLGEREHVAVPVAGRGAVGDAVGLQSGGDLQRVDGPFAEVAVAVHE